MTRARYKRRLASIVGLVLGILLVAYPIVTDMAAAWRASQAISEMSSEAYRLDDPERLAQLEQATSFNANVAGLEGSIEASEILPYEQQLTWQTPYIGWLEIPKIDVSLPIYHDADDDSLANGAGHVRGTSLPVGGAPSNCVISAHSGLQTARMFDDLRRLDVGDKVSITVLSEPRAYEVVGTEVVLPEDTEHLAVYDDGRDLLTLVTCTPIGVNDHRLLVTCERCDYDPKDFEAVPASAYLNLRTVPVMLVGAMLCIPWVAGIAASRIARRGLEREGG